jgi:hypothetical protein
MHNLTFSDTSGCSHKPSDTSLAIVHACKEPCHRCAAGYTQKSLPADHPHYLFLVRWQKNGDALDVNGNIVETRSLESHIPLKDFKFRPELFE